MGRQVRFYALPEDENKFFSFTLKNTDTVFIFPRSDTPELNLLGRELPLPTDEWSLVIWNTKFPIEQQNVRKTRLRKHDDVQKDYVETGEIAYFLDEMNAPVIQLSRSFINNKNLLIKGRIWAEMYALGDDELIYKGDKFAKWYERLSRWIRRNYSRHNDLDGYFGDEALKWYKSGGELGP